MRKLTKIIGVALIATGLMVSVTGCADPNSGLAELQAENESLKKELEDKKALEAWIIELFGDKESAEKFLSEYNTLKEALENDKITEGEYTEELQNLIDKINQLKNDKAKLQKQLDDLSASLDNIIATAEGTTLENKIKVISDEIASLNAKLKENSGDTTTYETKIAELKARVNELIAENEQLKEAAAKVTYKVEIGDDITRPLELSNIGCKFATYTEVENYGYLTCFKKDKPKADWFDYSVSGKKLSLETKRDENNVDPLIVINAVSDGLDD